MTEEEFLTLRKPFYLSDDTLLVRTPTSKHMNATHAQWFHDVGIPYVQTIRGYYIQNSHITLYINDFEIPSVSPHVLIYLFEYFPDIKYIGLGCNKGKVGEIWRSKLQVYKNDTK